MVQAISNVIENFTVSEDTESESDLDEDEETEPSGIDENENINVKTPSLQPRTTAQLLITRSETLFAKREEIGALCLSILENPQDTNNLKTLLNMMDEYIPEMYLTIKKLVIISLLEVFKDIIPSYPIKHQNNKDVKCKY